MLGFAPLCSFGRQIRIEEDWRWLAIDYVCGLDYTMMRRLSRFAMQAILIGATCAGVAQGPPGQDPYNPPPGHGGVPPGQAKKHGNGEKGMPPGQAKKYFREEDREHFYGHYHHDADRWHGHKRPVFVPGHYVSRDYAVQPVPRSYWVGVVAPPPPGCEYGYYGGYVVAYNPTTRMIADVLDLVATAAAR
jgi:hypothetical protein